MARQTSRRASSAHALQRLRPCRAWLTCVRGSNTSKRVVVRHGGVQAPGNKPDRTWLLTGPVWQRTMQKDAELGRGRPREPAPRCSLPARGARVSGQKIKSHLVQSGCARGPLHGSATTRSWPLRRCPALPRLESLHGCALIVKHVGDAAELWSNGALRPDDSK